MDGSFLCQLLLSALLALSTTLLIEKHDEYMAALLSEPTTEPMESSTPLPGDLPLPDGEPMDVDPAMSTCRSPSSPAPRGLPFPGRLVVNGVHEVVHKEM